MRSRRWTEAELRWATLKSTSIRQVLSKLGLREAGGNYKQIRKYLDLFKINYSHFKGRAWNKGVKMPFAPRIPLSMITVRNSFFQSYKLKTRLLRVGLKKQKCELCGWSQRSVDGRVPLELDHINGDNKDNRLVNLRILCPNCHSLQPTHRGLNSKGWWRNGIRARLKSV